MCLVLFLQAPLQVAARILLFRELIECRRSGLLTLTAVTAVFCSQLAAVVRSLFDELLTVGVGLP
ncbi:hypothetical protein D3C80_1799420 [compost metagenome]